MPARKAAPVDEAALMPPSQTIADLAERMRDAAALMNAAIVAPKRESSRDIDRSAMAAAEPVVHVTIGWVEVRATTETQRESKAKVASPVMGLEDYLQRRAQRGGQ
ncbi:MAG TPA: hypothetical protein VLZ50_00865 [Terracidiphilus sp.]|nr:hypothetical protein [Terracidiphilus sp.]